MKVFVLLVFICHSALASIIPAEELMLDVPLKITANWTVLDSEVMTVCLSEINQQRANNGRQAVQVNGQVEQAAYNHNKHMMDNNCFSHQCPGEPGLGQRLTNTGYRWGGVGEILALGHRDCAAAVQGWMNSEGHRNILLGNYRHVGCSSLTCSGCPRAGPWWTCVFANPL